MLECFFKSLFERKSDIEEIYQELKKNLVTKEDLRKEFLRNLSFLKRRIVHSFLPIVIDLQGIREVYEMDKKGEREEDIKNYLKETFEDTDRIKAKTEEMERLIMGDDNLIEEVLKKRIKGILNEIDGKEAKEKAQELFEELEKLMEDDRLIGLEDVLGDFEDLKMFLGKKENCFHKWFLELVGNLEEIEKLLS